MITYFVHSTSTDNEQRLFSGWNNLELSAKGLGQAKRLGQRLPNKHFDIIFTSDLLRAQQTAALAFPNAQVITDARLREMNYGDLNGLGVDIFHADPLLCIHTRYPNGENCMDVENRMRSFLRDIPENADSIAIISHKYPQLAMDVICQRMSWKKAIDNDWRKSRGWQPGWEYRYDK